LPELPASYGLGRCSGWVNDCKVTELCIQPVTLTYGLKCSTVIASPACRVLEFHYRLSELAVLSWLS